MRNFVVITTIFEPTAAIKSFASIRDIHLIVVADRKTPGSWQQEGAAFFSLEDQEKECQPLAKLVPFNHYARKMLGYLKAIQAGANTIIDADDDIYPKSNWAFPDNDGDYDTIETSGFINIYSYFTSQRIWARGLPVKEIVKCGGDEVPKTKKRVSVGIWQGLSDKQPDVDAIFRLQNNQDFYFDEADPIVLDRNTISPFNSQNTCFRREVFPLLYLPTTVSFRFTDILRSYIAQPILWNRGFNLGFVQANTIQHRNLHNADEDFMAEIPMYQHAGSIPGIVSSAIQEKNSIEDNLFLAYQALINEKIVGEKELVILESWLKRCQISSSSIAKT